MEDIYCHRITAKHLGVRDNYANLAIIHRKFIHLSMNKISKTLLLV